MFSKEDWFKNFPHVHEVHFTELPGHTNARLLVIEYFGEMLLSDNGRSGGGAAHIEWCIAIPGESGGVYRYIEAVLDLDTYEEERTEPFYFLVRNQEDDDAITLAIARGLAEFIAQKMGGKLMPRS